MEKKTDGRRYGMPILLRIAEANFCIEGVSQRFRRRTLDKDPYDAQQSPILTL